MAVGSIMGNVLNVSIAQVTIDVPSIAANSSIEHFFTLTNARPGDFVDVQPMQFQAGIVYGKCRVTSFGTVGMAVYNVTAAPIDPGSQPYRFLVARPEGGQIIRSIIAD